MENNLRKLAYELNGEVSSMSIHLITLEDVTQLMLHLREDMDKAVYEGEEKLYFRDNHRSVRVLSELMFFLMKDLKKNFEIIDKTQDEIFDQIVKKGNQEKTSTIASSEGKKIS